MKQVFSITALGLCGLIALASGAAIAGNVPEGYGAPIVLAKAPAYMPERSTRIRQSLAMLPGNSMPAVGTKTVAAKTLRESTDLPADDLITTSIGPSQVEGSQKRNLEFSGRSGPKLRIGLKQKKVRFALNFKVVDDVFFAPAYRLAISRADFQNPDGYWAHSLFFGMRFNFNSDAK